jgi:tetratricopeptide (TPR) repeat protein
MVLAGNLLKDVQRIPGTPTTRTKSEAGKQDRKLVFIGYDAAGWVIQEALAWYSNTSTQTARRTALVILLNAPHIKDEAALRAYLESFSRLYPAQDKATLSYSVVKIIQDNFKQLIESSFGPEEARITIGAKANPSPTPTNYLKTEVNIQDDPAVLRRETTDTHHTTDSTGTNSSEGTNSSDSSKDSSGSGTTAILKPIPLGEIGAGDETDREVRRLLHTSLTLPEKSDNMVSPKYRRVGTGISSVSPKSPNKLPQGSSPPTPPDEIDDPTSKMVLARKHTAVSDSQAVQHVPNLLEAPATPAPSNRTMSGDTLTEVYVESNRERSHTPTEMEFVPEMDPITETDEESASQEDSPETKPAAEDALTPNPAGPPPNYGQLLRLAALYQQSGELQKSKALYERLVNVPALKDGSDIIRFQIAITWLYEGRVKMAQKVFTELEPKVKESYAKQPQRTWEVRRWLAVSLDMQGLYEQGKKKLIAINDAFSSLQQATDVGLLTKSTLALLFGHLGKYEEALKRSKEVLQLALEAVEKAKKGGKGDTASVTRQRGALGSIQYDRAEVLTYVGRYVEAEEMNTQALENIQRNLGSKHVSTLNCWSLKARHLAATSRLPEAEEQCQKTLKVMRKEIGKEHPSTLKTLGVLVYVYRLQARLTEALDTAKYLLEKCRTSDAFGEDHPETISSMWQLAEVYLARGDFKNALHYQDQAVKLADKVLGKVHPTVVSYRACLARVYCNRGNWAHTATLCVDILKDYGVIISEAFQDGQKQEKSEDSRDVLISSIQQALDRKKAKSATEARQAIYQQALDRARHIFIVDNDDFETLNLSVVLTMQCLGVTERERLHGNLEVAEEIQTKAHEYIEKKLGKNHADTLSSKWDLALTKLKRNQDGALSELEHVTASRRRVLGEDHPDTLAARHHLSVAKFNMFRNLSELAEQAEVLRLCIHLLGEEHPSTNSARIDLSNGYHLVGMLTDAEQLLLKALKVQIKTLPHPDLISAARKTYETALDTLGLNQHKSHSAHEQNEKDERSGVSPVHCHAQVVSSLAALALIYVDMAQSADEAALASVQNSSPESEKAHQLLVSKFNEKAIALQRAVIEQQRLLGGPSSRETLESINTLALIYQAAGLTAEAIEQFKLVQSQADESSILHFTSQSNLGTLLFAAGEFEKAEEIQRMAYEKRTKFGEGVVGPKEFVKAVFNLALTRKELKRGREALDLMEQALRLSRDAFGHGDPTTERILDTWRDWRESLASEEGNKAPKYHDASRKDPTDWDEFSAWKYEDEGGEGEEEDVDSFFKKIYRDADPDTRRAMMKSYQEARTGSSPGKGNDV